MSKKVNVENLDAQLAEAKAKKAAKKAKLVDDAPAEAAPAEGEKVARRPRLTEEEKAARASAKEAARAEKKKAREEKRAAKQAEREAARKPAHMAKVQRAAAKLPTLSERAAEIYNDITSGLSRDQVTALGLHLAHFNRVMATTAATNVKLEAGMRVTITGGDPRFVGKTGVVEKSQRIRCYVSVEGFKKPLYCFTSDCSPMVEATEQVAVNG